MSRQRPPNIPSRTVRRLMEDRTKFRAKLVAHFGRSPRSLEEHEIFEALRTNTLGRTVKAKLRVELRDITDQIELWRESLKDQRTIGEKEWDAKHGVGNFRKTISALEKSIIREERVRRALKLFLENE